MDHPEGGFDQAFSLLNPAVARTTAPADKKPDPSWGNTSARTWQHADVEIRVLDGELTMIQPEADNLWESRILLKPVREHTFRLTPTGTTFGAIGELLTFECDTEGKVQRARMANSYWVRK